MAEKRLREDPGDWEAHQAYKFYSPKLYSHLSYGDEDEYPYPWMPTEEELEILREPLFGEPPLEPEEGGERREGQ